MFMHNAGVTQPFDPPTQRNNSVNPFKLDQGFTESTVIECIIEGTYNSESFQFRVEQSLKQLTLLDVKRVYFHLGKSPGVFHMKTVDDSATNRAEAYHWTVVTAENVPLLEFGEPSTSPIEAPHLQDPMQQMHMEMPVHAMSTQQEVISHAPVTHYYNGVPVNASFGVEETEIQKGSVPNGGNVANFMNPFAHPDVILKVKHIVPRKVKRYIKKGEPGYKRPKPTYIKKGQPGYKRPKYYYKRKTGGREDEADGGEERNSLADE